MKRSRTVPALLLVAALALTACGSSSAGEPAPVPGQEGLASTLRLGYFANVTHASAVYGVTNGDFTLALGDTELETSVFGAGPAAVEALASGDLDATFIGPNPAINAFAQTDGELLRIVAGTTSGGAALVVDPAITSVEQLAGTTIATPSLGSTQDVALKAFLAEEGVEDVEVVNQDNAVTLDLLQQGQIDGGWVPEPWASRLVLEGGGAVLVDEHDLWPDGAFVTTHLVVRTEFLEQYPGTIEALVQSLIDVTDVVATKSPEVQSVVNAGLEQQTGRALPDPVLAAAFADLTPTVDPIARSLAESASDAQEAGLLDEVDLTGIYDLSILDRLLQAAGRTPLDDAGLG